jgi:hypothetical protein
MPRLISLLLCLLLSSPSFALSLTELSQGDAASGLKQALNQGAKAAVAQLGRPGGFSSDPQVRIGLPGKLGKAARTMKLMGMGAQVEQLEASMNQAAEAAVPQAQALLLQAVQNMTLQDAKAILAGPQDSATRYLDKSSHEQLRSRFLPIVRQATQQVGLAQQYNAFAGQAASFGVIDAQSAQIENYVTEQALNGLFKIIAEQEAGIRRNPAQAAGSLARKVFGLQ